MHSKYINLLVIWLAWSSSGNTNCIESSVTPRIFVCLQGQTYCFHFKLNHSVSFFKVASSIFDGFHSKVRIFEMFIKSSQHLHSFYCQIQIMNCV
jgi:hypothetical protein